MFYKVLGPQGEVVASPVYWKCSLGLLEGHKSWRAQTLDEKREKEHEKEQNKSI